MTRHTLRDLANAAAEFASELAADYLRRTVGKLLGLPAMEQRVRELEARLDSQEARRPSSSPRMRRAS